MSSNLLEAYDAPDPARHAGPAAVAARLKALAERFPSISKGLLSILDQAIVSGTGFLTATIVGRTTSPEEFGLFYLLLSIVFIASGVQEHVIAGPYMVLSKRRKGAELAEYGGSTWLHHFILTALMASFLIAVIAVCWLAGGAKFLPGLWALLGVGPLLLLRDGIRRFSFAKLQLKAAIALDVAVALAQLGGLLALAYFDSLSVVNILAVMAGACLLACLIWFLLDSPSERFSAQRCLADWRHNWAFGRWLLWSYLMGGTAPYVVLWIVGLTIDTSEAAILGACGTIVRATSVLLTGITNVLTPMAAQAYATNGVDDLRRILSRTAAFFVLALGGFCLFVGLTGDWLPVFVFGEFYRGSGPVLFTLAVSMLMTGLGMVAGNGLWAIDRTRSSFVSDAYNMFATLLAAVLLIHPFGALGAALATLAGTFSAALVRSILLARHFGDDALESSPTPNSAFLS
jgi:O-antigen/teichoic acid export membrane protein